MAYILFDIGGTKTRVAVSYDLKTIEQCEKFDTPSGFAEGIAAIHDAIERMTDKPIEAMAGGIRGPLNVDKTTIVSEKVLADWVEQPIASSLGKPWRAPVFLENDAALAALGEAHFGSGQGGKIIVYHTISTGVGGALVVNGAIAPNTSGFEPGHQILDIDRSILGKDIPHTLENLVSGNALERRTGIKPYEIPQDDPVWQELAGYLAKGLRNTVVYWSPDTIVLGGSMIVGNPRILLEDIKKALNLELHGLVDTPKVVDAQFRDEVALYGAMTLIEMKSS